MIENIKLAIQNLNLQRDRINDEYQTTMAVLRSCRFLDFSHIDLIDKRYRDKISSINRDLDEMLEHLSALEKEAANA